MTTHNDTPPTGNSTRRTFLKASAATVAGLSIARGAHAGSNDVIKVGMVGCGGRCSGAAGNAMSADPGARLVAMTDIFADRVQGSRAALKRQFPDQVAVDDDHCFSGLEGYKQVIDSVDVILVACAAKFHPLYLKAGIDAGKHVFVEKPHGIDPSGINTVNEATKLAEEKNLGILSGLQSRFHPAISETIERVKDGQIGDVVAIEENFVRGPYGRTNYPQGASELEAQYGNQYRFSWLCGDDVPQSLVHNMDRATWALDETPPVDAHGFGGRSGRDDLLGDVFDHNVVVYRYASGTRVYACCRTTLSCYNENSSIIMGSKGIAYPNSGRITGPNAWRFSGQGKNPYLAEHQEFFQSIRAGTPINCGEYMARSTLVTIMGQLSCYSGKLVTWDQVTKSDYCIEPRPEDCTMDMDPPTARDEEGVYPVCAMPGVTTNI